MSRALTAVLLFGLVAVAFAADAKVQKKYPSSKRDEYYTEKYEERHETEPVRVKHVTFSLSETEGKTWPCDAEHEVLGATTAYNGELFYEDLEVGDVYWSGIVVQGKSHYYKEGVEKEGIKVNIQVVFDFNKEGSKEYEGVIVAGGVDGDFLGTAPVKLAILGGTGAFAGVGGSVFWTHGEPKNTYKFDLWVPKPGHDYEYDY